MKAEQMRSLAARSRGKHRPSSKGLQVVFQADMRPERPPVTSVALCSWPVTDPSSEHWDKMSLIHSRLGIIKDGVLNQPPPWDSLCSQQWVMSVPRALKLTLIIALKTITKQQELADISGGCMVTVDGVMFTWGQKINLKRHLCVHHSAMLKMYTWVCNNRATGNINR